MRFAEQNSPQGPTSSIKIKGKEVPIVGIRGRGDKGPRRYGGATYRP